MKRTMIATGIALALGTISALALLLLLGGGSHVTEAQGPDSMDTYYVAPGGDCGTGISPCYASVQDAVDAADDPGDVVKVAAGTYTGVQSRPAPVGYDGPGTISQTVYISKTLTVRGGYTTTNWTVSDPDTNPTVLDALGQGRVVFITGDISLTVEGLRVTGGDAAGLGGHGGADGGGGVYVDAAMVALCNNHIYSNTAHSGGGFYLLSAAATLSDNRVCSNTVPYYGGGGYVGESDDARILGNVFANNTTANLGGGLHIQEGSGVFLGSNTVISNTAHNGGGLTVNMAGVTFVGNAYLYNSSHWSGGAVSLSWSDAQFVNDVFADNQCGTSGSVLEVRGSSLRLVHATLARNHGVCGANVTEAGAPHTVYSTVALTNTIIVGHQTGICVSLGNTATLEATLWGSGAWANGTDWSGSGTIVTGTPASNVWGDPGFVDPDNGNYHIGTASAAVDAGVDAGVTSDMDGQTRPGYGGYDLGADELWLVAAAKTATPGVADPGEMVTYTLVLTNVAGTPLMTSFTDALPAQVDYLGPLTYTHGDGGYASGVVTWTGTVYTNTPARITWAVQVASDTPYSTTIPNVAVISDVVDTFQTDPALILVPPRRVYLPLVLRQYP